MFGQVLSGHDDVGEGPLSLSNREEKVLLSFCEYALDDYKSEAAVGIIVIQKRLLT